MARGRMRWFSGAAAVCLAASCLAGCGSANGQIEVKNDPFDGPTRVFTRSLDEGDFTGIGMQAGGGDYVIQVFVVAPGHVPEPGKVGDKGDFKLGSETLTLEASSAAPATTMISASGVYTRWGVVFVVKRDQLARFAKAPLSAVRVAVGERLVQLTLVEDDSELIMENSASLVGGSG